MAQMDLNHLAGVGFVWILAIQLLACSDPRRRLPYLTGVPLPAAG